MHFSMLNLQTAYDKCSGEGLAPCDMKIVKVLYENCQIKYTHRCFHIQDDIIVPIWIPHNPFGEENVLTMSGIHKSRKILLKTEDILGMSN